MITSECKLCKLIAVTAVRSVVQRFQCEMVLVE